MAGSEAPADHSLDLPQVFLWRGVMAYVANTGYGWGLLHGIGYSAHMVRLLTEELTAGGSFRFGDAVLRSKERYFMETPIFDPYDAKTSMQWALFGFPMYEVIHTDVAYTLTVLNNGPDPAGLVEAATVLPEDIVYSGTLEGWTCELSNGVQTCRRDTLAAGVQSTIEISVDAPGFEGVLQGNAFVTAADYDPNLANNLATGTTIVRSLAHIFADGFESGDLSRWSNHQSRLVMMVRDTALEAAQTK